MLQEKGTELIDVSPYAGDIDDSIYVCAESAISWLRAHWLARFRVETWAEYAAAGNTAGMQSFLTGRFNPRMHGSLIYQVHFDPETEGVRSEVIASSLQAALDVQWGMSLAAGTVHRQCSQCTTWFAVHPGTGRPEKTFCSDACRMRAYRKRKRQSRDELHGLRNR